MKKEYQRDIYETIDEFINEYSPSANNYDKSRGMDFSYKKVVYRLCREYDEVFYLYKDINDDFVVIKICNSINELLGTKVIDNKPLENIIMDDKNTIIFGKD